MAIRRPLYVYAEPTGVPVTSQLYEYPDAEMTEIITFAGYVHAQNPALTLEVNTTNGVEMPNQAFSDTYYIAGASTTDVTNYDTAGETPNISMVTDVYNRIRIIDNQGSLPTTDANNLEYPLYLNSDSPRQLRAMTRLDFIDTFVTPALPQFSEAAGTVASNGGSYFLTNSNTPANASIVGSVPVAINSVADVSAYTSGGIGEVQKQTVDVNYWLAKVDFPIASYDPTDITLPMYFDAGTETIKQHTSATWTALLGPFLRYYLGGGSPAHAISYSINGGGTTQGVVYTDSRRDGTSTYNTRFVNANDYRTQEFPAGAESTVAGSEKRLKRAVGNTQTISLLGTSASPSAFDAPGPIFDGDVTFGDWEVRNGFNFTSTGNIERITYPTFTGGTEVTHATAQWCNVSPNAVHYIRFTDDTAAVDTNSQSRVPSTGYLYTQTTYEWKIQQSPVSSAVSVIVTWDGTQVGSESYPSLSVAQGKTQLVFGGFTYYKNPTVAATYTYTIMHGLYRSGYVATRYSANQGNTLSTWHSLATDKEFRWASQEALGTYGARFMQCRVDISTTSNGSNIIATGYYRTIWSGEGTVDFSNMSAQGTGGNTLTGDASATFELRSDGTAVAFASATGGVVSTSGTPQTWLFGGTASDYEVNFGWTHYPGSIVGGGNDGGSVPSGPANTAWLNCGTTRTWNLFDDDVAAAIGTMSGLVTLRHAGNNAIVDTGSVVLKVDYTP
tara:strand:+ start:4323 stop:6503 length:2181 start_codon:yes stop_codon:yes gene_type:complete